MINGEIIEEKSYDNMDVVQKMNEQITVGNGYDPSPTIQMARRFLL